MRRGAAAGERLETEEWIGAYLLAPCDASIGYAPQLLGFVDGGLYAAVLNELGHHCAQHRPAMG